MRKKSFVICIALCVLFFYAGCGTTLIRQQERKDYSAVTMYVHFSPFVLESITIKNNETGTLFENKRYGWGKEFFPHNRRYSFLVIGNLPPGNYDLHSIKAWSIIKGNKIMFDIPLEKGMYSFQLKKNDILYLGDLQFFIFKDSFQNKDITEAEKKFHSTLKGKPIRWKIFTINTSQFKHPLKAAYMHADYPDPKNKVFRKGEKNFLRFFASKKSQLPQWGLIAERKLSNMKTKAPSCGKEFDFRCVKWRMTKNQVIKSEKGILPKNNSKYRIIYESSFYDYESALLYIFDTNGRLAYASYSIKIDPSFAAEALKDVKEKLKLKYGNFIKTENSYVWKSGKSTIMAGISTNKRSINIAYSYMSYNDWKKFVFKMMDKF